MMRATAAVLAVVLALFACGCTKLVHYRVNTLARTESRDDSCLDRRPRPGVRCEARQETDSSALLAVVGVVVVMGGIIALASIDGPEIDLGDFGENSGR